MFPLRPSCYYTVWSPATSKRFWEFFHMKQRAVFGAFACATFYSKWAYGIHLVKVDGRHSQRWRFSFRGFDKPRLMGVAIAIDPFQVVYPKTGGFLFGMNPSQQRSRCVLQATQTRRPAISQRDKEPQDHKCHCLDISANLLPQLSREMQQTSFQFRAQGFHCFLTDLHVG